MGRRQPVGSVPPVALPLLPAVVTPPVAVPVPTTAGQQLLDVTGRVGAVVEEAGLGAGVAHVFCPHTSCGLAITEDEEGLHEDLAAVLEQLAPAGRGWAHDDLSRRWQNLVPGERANGHSHLRALLSTLPAVALPIVEGRLELGRWQRLFLVELDGPRIRTVHVQGTGARAASGPTPSKGSGGG
jgi:secondary thiamine-phosphate synthase enzyme